MRKCMSASLALSLAVSAAGWHGAAAGDFKLEEGFTFLFNGKNLDGWKTSKGGEALDGKTEAYKGRFVVKVDKSGIYQIQTRHRVAPAAAGQPGQSFTYALTFESLR